MCPAGTGVVVEAQAAALLVALELELGGRALALALLERVSRRADPFQNEVDGAVELERNAQVEANELSATADAGDDRPPRER